MKITAGKFKGRKISCPLGKEIRPTLAKVREGIFNVLFSLNFNINETNVLELFAGTGLVSFESISRGAKSSTVVDISKKSLKVIEENALILNLKDKINFINQDAIRYTFSKDNFKEFSLIFFDPPYDYENHKNLLINLADKISKNAIIVVECNKEVFNENDFKKLELIKLKKWGKTFVSFIKRKEG
jgi:16S rRNA (guanine966-N2)-methyltransferase